MVIWMQALFPPHVIDDVDDAGFAGASVLTGDAQVDPGGYAGDAAVSTTLVANIFQLLWSLNGDASFVLLDGPEPAVRDQDDERVMQDILWHLPPVQRVSVIADFIDLFGWIGQVFNFLSQFWFRWKVIGSQGCQLHVRIEVV